MTEAAKGSTKREGTRPTESTRIPEGHTCEKSTSTRKNRPKTTAVKKRQAPPLSQPAPFGAPGRQAGVESEPISKRNWGWEGTWPTENIRIAEGQACVKSTATRESRPKNEDGREATNPPPSQPAPPGEPGRQDGDWEIILAKSVLHCSRKLSASQNVRCVGSAVLQEGEPQNGKSRSGKGLPPLNLHHRENLLRNLCAKDLRLSAIWKQTYGEKRPGELVSRPDRGFPRRGHGNQPGPSGPTRARLRPTLGPTKEIHRQGHISTARNKSRLWC
jgi:hypothetical protein